MLLSPRHGCLLVAAPELLDPAFACSVVVLLAHSAAGSCGLVLNRPAERMLGEVLPETAGEAGDVPLYLGGPVAPETLQYLARAESADDEDQVLDGVIAGGTLPDLVRCARQRRSPRGYLGHAGWAAGQLEHELTEGAWIVAPANADLVFAEDSAALWSRVLRGLGGRYAWLSLRPADPADN